MKPSEMTNEELAKQLLSRVPLDSNSHDDLREAAAPDLYDALYNILRVAENRLPSQPTLDEIEAVVKAKAALAKASGEGEVRQ